MLTRTSEYALRALIHLAQRAQDWPIPGNEIARCTGIPAKYLSAILSELVRRHVLESARGKRGGFSMARPPQQISLLEVLSSFERFDERRCPFGSMPCNDEQPCAAHDEWKQVVAAEQRFLGHTTVQDVAERKKKKPRARLPVQGKMPKKPI